MFTANSNARTPPTLVSCFSFAANLTLEEMLTEIGASSPELQCIIGSIFFLILREANAANQGDLRQACRNMFLGDLYTNIIDDDHFMPITATTTASGTPAIAAIQERLLNNLGFARGWIQDLVNGAKKNHLDDGNVDGYFASLGTECARPAKIAKFINTISPYLADRISQQAFRNSLSDNAWTTYRCTRFSAGKIMFQHIDVLLQLGVLTNETAQYVREANDAPWDGAFANRIPVKAKAYASIYLEASGKGIDKWVQGTNAVGELPPAKARAAKRIFKKFLDLSSDVDAIEKTTDVAGLIEAIPDGFFN